MSQAVLESLRRLQRKQATSGPRAGTSRPGPGPTPRRESGPQRAREGLLNGGSQEAVLVALRAALRRVSRAWTAELEARLLDEDRAALVAAEAVLNRAWTAEQFEEAALAVEAWERLWFDVIRRRGTA